jgi:hypothetical protein
MRQLLWKGLAGSGLLWMALSGSVPARAQDWNRGDREYRQNNRSPVDRLMYDLNRAESNARLDWGDRRRFDKARQEIAQFERKWSAGRFDRRELDQAIASVQRVVDSRSLNYRDRAALNEDLNRLREFRATSGRYSYGYR